jgi:phosphatidylglycerol:prolipoprotein diacylglycerol transferase
MLPFVTIGNQAVSMYGLMWLAGFALALLIALLKRKTFALDTRQVLNLFFAAVVGAVIGARLAGLLGYILLHGTEQDFWSAQSIFAILRGGGVFYGGLSGAFALTVWCAKMRLISADSSLGIFSYAAWGFNVCSRIGCYCAGCCYGVVLSHGERFPVQLAEAAFCTIILFAILLFRPERRWNGRTIAITSISAYAIGRLFLEFYRGDANRGVWLLSTSQWISLFALGLSVYWLIRNKHLIDVGIDCNC